MNRRFTVGLVVAALTLVTACSSAATTAPAANSGVPVATQAPATPLTNLPSAGASSAAASAGAGATMPAPQVTTCDPTAFQKAYPSLAGRTITVGLAPFSPGYEVIDPNNPNNIVGLDPDLIGATLGCIGLKYKIVGQDFSTLVAALQAKRIDLIWSSMYATPARAAIINFVLYQKSFTGAVVQKGNPKNVQSLQDVCGLTAAEVTGTVEAQTLIDQGKKCVADGKPDVTMTYYKDNDTSVNAVQTKRADLFMTDGGLAGQLAAKFSSTLQLGFQFSSGYNFGAGVNKSDSDLLNAVYDAVTIIQANGTEATLLKKWNFDPSAIAPAAIVTH